MHTTGRRLRIRAGAPAVLAFTGLCFLAQLLNLATHGAANRLFFSVYRSSPANPFFYVRLVGHVFGHASWDHLMGNVMYLLILGPMLEEKYGSSNLVFVMLATALVTGLVNVLFFPHTALLGASGVVFAMILLSSLTTTNEGEIPLTFLLVAALYLGQQIAAGLTARDNVSQLTHIAGGVVGSVLGFVMNRAGMNRRR